MSIKTDTKGSDSGGASSSAPQQEEAKGVVRLALELLKSEEKSAADREAKLAVIKFLASLEGRGDDYIKGYREGYVEGFKRGYDLRVTEEETEGHRYGVE